MRVKCAVLNLRLAVSMVLNVMVLGIIYFEINSVTQGLKNFYDVIAGLDCSKLQSSLFEGCLYMGRIRMRLEDRKRLRGLLTRVNLMCPRRFQHIQGSLSAGPIIAEPFGDCASILEEESQIIGNSAVLVAMLTPLEGH